MVDQFEFGREIFWRPTADVIEDANLTDFIQMQGIEDFEVDEVDPPKMWHGLLMPSWTTWISSSTRIMKRS